MISKVEMTGPQTAICSSRRRVPRGTQQCVSCNVTDTKTEINQNKGPAQPCVPHKNKLGIGYRTLVMHIDAHRVIVSCLKLQNLHCTRFRTSFSHTSPKLRPSGGFHKWGYPQIIHLEMGFCISKPSSYWVLSVPPHGNRILTIIKH